MGDESRVTQAIRWVKNGVEPGMQSLKAQLAKRLKTARRRKPEQQSGFRDPFPRQSSEPGGGKGRGPGQLGVFDAPNPWGPWITIAYYEDWGKMGPEDEGLTCGFPQKWMSTDGLTLWCTFSVYGDGARRGIHAHDRFNLIEATLQLCAR